MPSCHTDYAKILKLRSNHWHTKCKNFFGIWDLSLLHSHFLGCHATLPQRNCYSQPNHTLFLWCFWFVCPLLNIIAKCKWCKISCERAYGANNEGFLAFVSRHTHPTKNGLCSRAMIIMDEKNVNKSPNGIQCVRTGDSTDPLEWER